MYESRNYLFPYNDKEVYLLVNTISLYGNEAAQKNSNLHFVSSLLHIEL